MYDSFTSSFTPAAFVAVNETTKNPGLLKVMSSGFSSVEVEGDPPSKDHS